MDQHTESVVSTPTTTTTETSSPTKKRPTSLILALLLGIAVAVLGYFLYTRLTVPTVAVVNGTKITEAELIESVDLMKRSAEMQGIDTQDPTVVADIRSQSLSNLIDNALLLGAAAKAGINPEEGAVQEAYNTLVEQMGDEATLLERMTAIGLSKDSLMENIEDRVLVDAYLEATTDIESLAVTDEEIEAYIASISTEGMEVPPLDEIRPQLEATIIRQKQETIVTDLLEKLRAEGDVTITE